MAQQQLEETLCTLLAHPEGRIVEFKTAKNQYDEDKLGRYFTALANEANLTDVDAAWIIFGVDDARRVVGTQYLHGENHERQLRMKVEEGTQPSSGFRDIHELQTTEGRVLLFEVPPAPRGIPMAWKGHYYARDGENLVPLALDKIDEIRQQTLAGDWTAAVVPEATIQHLDLAALAKAREAFAAKHPEAADEISAWTNT
ncbi:MAG: ATP-binding protein, partial [Propionibacteriaceae bacterium]|nr:ATP-binding protein [Propionibacteriaceae bacterium]